jgi:hypothetical protein
VRLTEYLPGKGVPGGKTLNFSAISVTVFNDALAFIQSTELMRNSRSYNLKPFFILDFFF